MAVGGNSNAFNFVFRFIDQTKQAASAVSGNINKMNTAAKTSATVNKTVADSAKRAADNVKKFSDSTKKQGDVADKAANDNKKLHTSLNRVGDAVRVIDGPLGGISSRFEALSSSVKQSGVALVAAGLAMAGFTALMFKGVGVAVDFEKAMAEVSTLFSGDSTEKVERLSGSVRKLSVEFGKLPTDEAKALYQIVSAGASDSATAISVLTAANKLAVGGITDVFTAADGLTSILNAYGDRVKSATDVSDALFVAMKAGKTTIGELSAYLGQVTPLASQAGIAFDELAAAVAAVTLGGVQTSVAVASLRQGIASVLKPSSEAVKLAAQLGLEFNETALRTKGLAGFLQDVQQKTKGNVTALTTLFGSVESLTAVLALTGSQSEAFANILVSMGSKAGATEEAFKKMSETAAFQLDKFRIHIVDAGISVGNVLLKVIVPALKFLNKNFDSVVQFAQLLVAVIGIRLVGALALATRSFVLGTIEAVRYQLALASMAGIATGAAVRITAAATATNLANAALGLFGGLLGFAVTAIAATVIYVGGLNNAILSLKAVLAAVIIEVQKFFNYLSAPFTALVNFVSSNFEQLSIVVRAFFDDLKALVTDPLGDNDFSNFKAALNTGIVTSLGDAFDAAIAEVKVKNADLDDTLTFYLQTLKTKFKESGLVTDEVATALAEMKKKIEEVNSEIAVAGKENDKLSKSLETLNKKYKDQIVALGKTAEQTDLAILQALKQDKSYSKLSASTKKLVDETEELIKKYEKMKKSQDILDGHVKSIDSLSKKYEEANKNFGLTDTQIDRNTLSAIAASKEFEKLTDRQQETLKAAISNIDINEQLESSKKAYEEMVKFGEESFDSLFAAGDGGWKNMLDGWAEKFKTFLTKLALEAALKPIFLNVSAGVLGSSAGGSLGSSSEGGTFGTLSNALSAGNLFSKIGSGLSSPIFGNGTAIGNAINSIGTKFGFTGAPVAGGVGPTNGLASSFTPGALVGGIAGNLLASAIFGSKGIGASIGGTLGGIGGTVAGASILGPALGALGGPIGALAGSFLGTALGGLFGGKPSDKTQTSTFDLASGTFVKNTGLEGKKFSQENLDAANALGNAAAQLAQAIGGPDGLKDALTIIVGNRDGLRYQFNNETVVNAGSSVGDLVQMLVKDMISRVPEVADSLNIAIQNIDWSQAQDNIESIIADINFAAAFDSLGEPVDTIYEVRVQLDALIEQYDQMADTAERLGLNVKKVIDLQDKAVKSFVAQYNSSINSEILSITDPITKKIIEENARYLNQLAEAQSIQADTNKVDELHRLKMLQIINESSEAQDSLNSITQQNLDLMKDQASEARKLAESYSSVAGKIGETITGLSLSNISPLTLTEQRNIAEQQYRAALNASRAGGQVGLEALNALPDLAKQFLDFDRQLNSSNGAYTDNFDSVQRELEQAKKFAEMQVSVQDRMADSMDQQVALLQDQLDATNTNTTVLSDLAKALIDQFNQGQTLANPNRNWGVLVEQNKALALNTGYSGDFGSGGFNSWIVNQPESVKAIARQVVSQFGRVPGFADGGLPMPNRAYWTGERGPELRYDTRSLGVKSNESLQISDDSRVVSRLDRLEKVLMSLVEETVSVRNATVNLANKQDGNNYLQEIAKNTRPSKSAWKATG